MTELCTLPIDGLQSHPDNPRLGLRADVVERLAAEMARYGFGQQHAITVRPHEGGHQVICGHHRVDAARQCGLTEVPAWVVDMSDDEAFMQLVLGNTQGELSPLEIGMHALKAVPPAERQAGKGFKSYAARIGRTGEYIGRPESAKFYGPPEFFGGKRGWTLPDITIWSAPGEHHELKHKRPTFDGCYGLERYRLDALVRFANVTGQAVYYTIHDWCMAGAGRSSELMRNDLAHWVTADIATLARGCTRKSTDKTWYNGELVDAETWYWTADPNRKHAWFRPLPDVWPAAKAA